MPIKMMRHHGHMYRNPWYRGYMPRSYIAPHRLASFGCSICLIVFGIFFCFGGTIAIVMSKHVDSTVKKHEEDPRFSDPFFKKAREERNFNHTDITSVIRTIGIVLLSLGGILIISAVAICCFAKFHMQKNENKHENIAARPLNEGGVVSYPQPPPGSYPQQPAPPPGSYPQQPAPPPGSYSQQYPSYAPQPGISPSPYSQQSAPPASYPYPPMSQQVSAPPTSYPYPPTSQQSSAPPEPYPNEKPPQYQYSESQMPSTINTAPIGFKEG